MRLGISIGTASARRPSAAGVTLAVPVGFAWASPPLTITRSSDVLSTSFDITSLIPAVTNTWCVDPVAGNDATAVVNSRAQPLRNLATALAKTDVDQVRIINLTGDYIGRTTQSWNNTQPTRSLSVIVEGTHRYICAGTASSVATTWSVNGTFGNVYQAAITTANSHSVTDVSSKTTVTANCPPAYLTYTKVASIAAVSAAAGSWFHDGTNVYVRPFDDRNLTTNGTQVLVTGSSNVGRFPSVNNCTIYVQGMDFIGGRPWYSFLASTVTGTKAVFNHCTFQGSSVNNVYNGLNIAAFQGVYLYRCGAYYNGADGFNYHSNEGDGTTSGTSPDCIEIECAAIGNGTTGSASVSDNASTAHDFARVIRLNCTYTNSDDRVLIDVNSAQSWNLGCIVGQAIQTGSGKESIAAANSAQMWLDSCSALDGSNPKWVSENSAVLRHYNSGTVVNNGSATGTVSAYAP